LERTGRPAHNKQLFFAWSVANDLTKLKNVITSQPTQTELLKVYWPEKQLMHAELSTDDSLPDEQGRQEIDPDVAAIAPEGQLWQLFDHGGATMLE
jgi:hypothetical protein